MVETKTENKVRKELIISNDDIKDSKLISELFRDLSIMVNEAYGYCIRLDVAIAMFGKRAYNYMTYVGMGLNISYVTTYEDIKYVCYEGYKIMKNYRAYEIMCTKFKDDSMKQVM